MMDAVRWVVAATVALVSVAAALAVLALLAGLIVYGLSLVA